jgi:hypothetical protein
LTEVSRSEIEKALEHGDSQPLEQALRAGGIITFRFHYRKFLTSHYPDMKLHKIDSWRGVVYLLTPMIIDGLVTKLPEISVRRDNGSACVVTIKLQ